MLVRIVDVGTLVEGVSAHRTSKVSLHLDELEEPERRDWEARLNRALGACGCGEGTAGLLLGLLVAVALTRESWAPGGWRGTVAFALAVSLAGAVVGKVAGKIRGRLGAHRIAEELVSVVELRQATTG